MATGNITRLEGVWPETHERAVRDSAGVNLETKLGNINSNIGQLDQEVNRLNSDIYAPAVNEETTTDNIVPSGYSAENNFIEDSLQVIPAGVKLVGVTLFSSGSQSSKNPHIGVFDSIRTLLHDIDLAKIGTTDTYYDLSSYNITIGEGYHIGVKYSGYKYVSSISGRYKYAPTGNAALEKYFYGFTFKYSYNPTKLEELIADNSDLFDKSLKIKNPLMPSNYSSYSNSSPVEDLWQDLPVGAKLTKVYCSTRGAAGGNFTYLHIYDATRTQVGERIQLGQIQATDTVFDISAKNIIVQEGFHYCIQYVAAQYIGTNVNHYRYYTPSNDSYPFSGYQFGFSFEFETTKDKRAETALSGKYASFIGDSICEGANGSGGYALLVARKYGMLPPQNNGSSGAIVTSISGVSGRVLINTMVDKMDGNADFYIAEGGVNDSDLSAPIGTLSTGYTAELDTTTFYGAMETICKNLATLHHGKKVGYIFVHRVSLTTKYAYDYTGDNNYYVAAKECCEKWGIPFLDLNKHCPPLGCIASLKSSYTKDGDGYHPNEAGYNKYYVDRIAAWMQTL